MTAPDTLRARLGEYLERQQNTPWSEGYTDEFKRGYDTAIEEVDAIAAVFEARATPEPTPEPSEIRVALERLPQMVLDYFDMQRGEWNRKYGGDTHPHDRLVEIARAALRADTRDRP